MMCLETFDCMTGGRAEGGFTEVKSNDYDQ